MRALITRPKEDSTAIAERLGELGIETLIEPLMTVETVEGAEIDLDGVQAILLTSRNGVRALANATERRDVAVYAVGDSTAELARENGFATVESAGGDTESLAALVRQHLEPGDGALLHAAGAAVAGDLAGTLANDGFDVRRVELYATRPAAALTVATCGLLSDGGIDLVLFFSPRTAQTFVALINQAGLADACAGMTAICLSRAVARAVESLQWREAQVAERPNLRSMIEVAATAGAGAEAEANPGEAEADEGLPEPPPLSPPPQNRQPWGAGAAPLPAKRRSGAWAAGIAAIVVVAGAGIYAWPLVSARLFPPTGAAAAGGTPNAALNNSRNEAVGESARREMARRIARLEDAVKSLRSGPLARLEAASGEAAMELPRLASRLDEAEHALAQAASASTAGAAADARIAGLEKTVADQRAVSTARIDGLDTRVSGLATGAADGMTGTARLRAENDRLKSSLAAMTLRLEALEAASPQKASARPARGSALVLAVGQLREALRKPGPFPATLEALRAVGAGDAVVARAISVLAPLAASGVATRDRLAATYDAAAAAAARAALAPAGSGWIERTAQRLASVITIRREGAGVEGSSAQAVLARAEARLKAGDLEGADAALAGLTAEPAAAMAAWRGNAARRLAADGALDRLGRHAIQLLAASP